MSSLLIAEEESAVAESLADTARYIRNDLNITITKHAKEALKYIKINHYDLFLLGMEFESCTGIELAKKIRETENHKLTPIFFIVSVPVKKFDISGMSCSDIKLLPEREVRKALEVFDGETEKDDDSKNHIVLHHKGHTHVINKDEIIYIESNKGSVFIHTINKEIEVPSYKFTMEKLLTELAEGFIRCHREYIVNTKYVEEFEGTDVVKLKNVDIALPIGRKYKDFFKK